MPYKDPNLQREAVQRYSRTPKAQANRKARKAKAVARNTEYVNSLKSAPCTDCGGRFHFSAMDWDHVEDNKLDGVADLVAAARSLEVIQTEIDKCELVCSNCHRVRTWERNRT